MATPAHPTGGILLYGSAGPGQGATAITPSDTDSVATSPCRSLYITGAGNVALVCPDGTTPIITVAASTVLPIAASKVLFTGTTATGIFAIW